SVFAARNPWANLEQYTFENIAQWLKKVRDVDIYPTFKQAYERNEIDDREIELKLQQWLKQINPSIAKNHVETYARKSLDLAHLTVLNRVSESQDIANHRTNALNKTDDMNTTSLVSTYITDKNDKKLIDKVDYHVIKWCKLYVDDAQSGWTMPNRDQGLFVAWRCLVQHDPALSKKQRTRLKTLPDNAEDLLEVCLEALGVSEGQIQSYLENHLLALPGWA